MKRSKEMAACVVAASCVLIVVIAARSIVEWNASRSENILLPSRSGPGERNPPQQTDRPRSVAPSDSPILLARQLFAAPRSGDAALAAEIERRIRSAPPSVQEDANSAYVFLMMDHLTKDVPGRESDPQWQKALQSFQKLEAAERAARR